MARVLLFMSIADEDGVECEFEIAKFTDLSAVPPIGSAFFFRDIPHKFNPHKVIGVQFYADGNQDAAGGNEYAPIEIRLSPAQDWDEIIWLLFARGWFFRDEAAIGYIDDLAKATATFDDALFSRM